MSRGTILITGSDGFIGRHVAETARAGGWTTRGVTRTPASAEAQSTVRYRVDERIQLDLLSPDAEDRLTDAMDGVTAVIHAAARVQLFGPQEPIIRDNVATTARVLSAAARVGRPRMVFLSSASVLFEARDQPNLAESSVPPERCMNGYAESKKRCEALVHGYPGSSAILRPQAVIGPGDRTLLPPVLAAARSGRWRWVGQRDAAATDLLSIANLADYCLRAAERPDATGVFHLSDGEPVPIEALFRHLFEALGIRVGERRLGAHTARHLARIIETPMRWLTPGVEPPLTLFGIEVLTRTRTLDRTRALSYLGGPEHGVWQGLQRAVDALSTEP